MPNSEFRQAFNGGDLRPENVTQIAGLGDSSKQPKLIEIKDRRGRSEYRPAKGAKLLQNKSRAAEPAVTKAEERRVFVLLAVFLAPIASVVLVGGYGFAIWISQLLFGPPTH